MAVVEEPAPNFSDCVSVTGFGRPDEVGRNDAEGGESFGVARRDGVAKLEGLLLGLEETGTPISFILNGLRSAK